MVTQGNLKQRKAIKMVTISDQASRALYGACVTRGKAKGLLKKNPPSDKLAKAAWMGAQTVCNPYKLSIASMLFMSPEERAIYDEILALFEWMKAQSGNCVLLDPDRLALEKLGAW